MAAHKLPPHLQKSKVIKIMVTPGEFERYQTAKNRLLNSSPPLYAYDILKYCVHQIDDLALLEFLKLSKNDPIRLKLHNDYLFNRLDDRS